MKKELENEVISYILEYKEKYGSTLNCLNENSISFITDEMVNVKKVRKEINEFIPSNFKRLSLYFISYFKNHFNSITWSFISENFDLKDHAFIEKFKDHLNWTRISQYRSDLTKDFINRYENKLNLPQVLTNPAISKKLKEHVEERYNEFVTNNVKKHFNKVTYL